MMKSSTANWVYLAGGVFLMLLIFIIEASFHLLGTVSYLLIVLYLLWLLRYTRYPVVVGAIATSFIVVGFLMGLKDFAYNDSLVINRLLAIVTLWLAVFFTLRYRRLLRAEQTYKKQLNALFENATEGMVFINREGKIILINPCAEKMFGYEKNHLLGLTIETLVPERFRELHIRQRNEFFNHPVDRPMDSGRELFGLRKDGLEFPIDVSLSSYYQDGELITISFIVDVTERKKHERIIAENYKSAKDLNQQLESRVNQRTLALENALASVRQFNNSLQKEIEERKIAEDRLKKSQQLYSAIASNFPEGIIGVLDKNLKYVFVEGKGLSLAGLSEDVHLIITAQKEDLVRKAFRGENVSFDFTISDEHFDVLCTPLPDDTHIINEILIVVRNVTKFKILESNLVKLLNRERELNTMKSRFVTIASHEFRTPLTTILSSTFLLENYSAQDYEVKKKTHFERIKRSVNTLTELLNDFLSLGKLEEGKVKASYSEFPVKEELNEFIKEMESVKKKDQQLRLDYSGNGETIMLDKKMLRNIISNLVSNAIKYSPPDGIIDIEAELSENKELKIKVTDHGIGIPGKEQRHIFKRFFRAQNATNIEGTGLGLNIVRRYVRLLKGTIGFKSKLNKGTTFFVTLPVHSVTVSKEPMESPVIGNRYVGDR